MKGKYTVGGWLEAVGPTASSHPPPKANGLIINQNNL
jgi:hypothetical protein